MNRPLSSKSPWSQGHKAAIIDSSEDAIIGFCLEGVIRSWNPGAQRLYGYTALEAIGSHISILNPTGNPDEMPTLLERIKRGEKVRNFETTCVKNDGSLLDVFLSISPVKNDNCEIIGAATISRDITERKQEIDELALNKVKFETVFHKCPDPMVIAKLDGALIVEFNQAYASSAGYSREEITGKTTHDIIAFADTKHRDTMIAQLKERGVVTNLEVTFKKRDGRLVDALISASICIIKGQPHIVAMTKDIQTLRDTQAALRESDRLYRLISDNSMNIIFACDQDMRIVYTSPSIKNVLGYNQDEYLGQPLSALINPENADNGFHRIHQGLKHGLPATSLQSLVKKKDDSSLWLDILTSPIMDEQGLLVGYQAVAHDVTKRKQAEEALIQLSAGVAHNFNNTLMAVMSNAQAAQNFLEISPPNPQKAHDLLNNVVLASRNGRDIVNRLSRFVKTEQEMTLSTEVLNVSQMLSSLPDMVRIMPPDQVEASLEIRLNVDNVLPVQAPAGELMEVFLNLAINAVEAMPQGGVLEISGRVDDQQVIVEFKDTGVGADIVTLSRFFDPFFSTKGGQGLGLPVSRTIIRSLGGDISASSQPGQGSTLTIWLPFSQQPICDLTSVAAGSISRPLKLLLVEDEGLVAMGIVSNLESHGHQVCHVDTLAASLEALGQFRPDLVICDLGLPDATGFEVCVSLRQQSIALGLGDLPLVVLSGWSEERFRQESGQEPEPFAYLQKPVGRRRLLEVINRAAASLQCTCGEIQSNFHVT
jgi:PAS domain S-box-containing protein